MAPNAVMYIPATIVHYVLVQVAAVVSANQMPLGKVAAAKMITTTIATPKRNVVLTLIAWEVKAFAKTLVVVSSVAFILLQWLVKVSVRTLLLPRGCSGSHQMLSLVQTVLILYHQVLRLIWSEKEGFKDEVLMEDCI